MRYSSLCNKKMIMRKIFFLLPSKKPLTRETYSAKTPILPNCGVAWFFLVNHIIQEWKFCKIAQLFIVSFILQPLRFQPSSVFPLSPICHDPCYLHLRNSWRILKTSDDVCFSTQKLKNTISLLLNFQLEKGLAGKSRRHQS